MASLNKILLIGNAGKDPEIRVTQSGKKKASFSLATTERFKDKATGEVKDQTEWHNLIFWGGSADLVERLALRKGVSLYIEGRQTHRSYDDPSGQKRYVSEVLVSEFKILTPRAQGQTGGYQAGANAAQSAGGAPQAGYGDDYGADAGGDSDLPF